MKAIAHIPPNIPAALLILLWIYTGFDKILMFDSSRDAFHNQTFPSELAEILSYAVPVTELGIASLLLFPLSRWWGFLASIILLSIFTSYVGLIWVGAFPRVPCNCAGILSSMGWAEHLVFNLIFIAIGIYGLYQTPKKSPGYCPGPFSLKK